MLWGADLTRATMRRAVLGGADASRASLLGRICGKPCWWPRPPTTAASGDRPALFRRAKLIGAEMDGASLMACGGLRRAARERNQRGAVRRQLVRMHAIAISADGEFLASGHGDGSVRLWEVDSGQELRRFQGHENGVNSVAFSPDGRRLASGSYDQTVRLWEVDSGQELRRSRGTRTGSIAWRSARTDGGSPAAAMTRPCGSGRWTRDRSCDAPGHGDGS